MSQRIVILGGGFAGLNVARNLVRRARGRDLQITLISRDNFFLVTPLLFEAGSGVLEPRHAVDPIRPLFRAGDIRFVQADVDRVDFASRLIHAKLVERETLEINYDHLVIALGGETNTAIVPGAQKSLTFKTLADAIVLRNHVIQSLEQADSERDENRKRSLLRFVIIGAGLVGVELQGELAEFVHNAKRHYFNIPEDWLQFELIEHGERIMPEMDADLAEYAARVYRRRKINLRVKTKVAAVEPGKVTLGSGETIEAATVVVATGVTPSPVVKQFDLEKDQKHRVKVEATMRVAAFPGVWALGDCAAIPDPHGKPYPQLAQHAIREARVLAKNILAEIDGRPLEPFVYKTLGTLAALGRYKGVGRIGPIKLKGLAAWFAWRSYYLFQMPRWARRVRIMIDWTVALFFSYDVVELNVSRRADDAPPEQ